MSFQPNFSNFYPPHVLPRIELKFKAKELMRGNWPVLIGVTLLYLILTSFQLNYTYGESGEGTLLNVPEDASTMQLVLAFFSTTLSALGSAVASIGVGKVIVAFILGIVSALLIDGVLTYCYTAWFIRLAEIGKSRPLTFHDFAEGFSSGLPAMLAYIWQQLWLMIWSLLALPGFLLMSTQLVQVTQTSGSEEALFASVANGAASFAVLIGSMLYLIGMLVVFIIIIRYQFIFQLIADGRGKVGPRQALRYSCAITKGHIKDVFVFELSFIPWYLASAFTFGLAFFYVFPYLETSRALVYQWLRDQAFQDGRLDPSALGYMKASEKQKMADETIIDV